MNATRVEAAILAIGSLFWEKGVRATWRSQRLKENEAKRVSVPIRYGRCSSSRGGAYTMVFSSDARDADAGRAILIPCRNAPRRPTDLIHEAEILWAAETNATTADGSISRSWGCVAIMVNPHWKDGDAFVRAWQERFREEVTCHTATRVVSDDGHLRIPWPTDGQGRPVDVHIILATANVPSLSGHEYPSAEAVAKAWNTAQVHESEYFFENRRAGITTADDEMINALLNIGVRQHGASLLK